MDKAYSSCGEHFVDNLGDLIDQEGALVGDEIFVGEIVRPNVKDFINVDRILEDINEQAYDFAGEYVEGWPNLTSKEQDLFAELIVAFIDKHSPPKFFRVEKSVPYILTDEDLS